MATIKSYTDLEQSKKLAEILPLETADMIYMYSISRTKQERINTIPTIREGLPIDNSDIPCWSLASLLSVLPKEMEIGGQCYAPCLFPVQDKWLLKLWYNSNHTITSPIAIFSSDSPVDACVEMILKLHERKML